MKMTKIEFWRKVKENAKRVDDPSCWGIRCGSTCPYYVYGIWNLTKECVVCANYETREKALAFAESYIKRHEQKSKKKEHIRDATKKVDSYAKKLKKDSDLKYDDLLEIFKQPDPNQTTLFDIIGEQ